MDIKTQLSACGEFEFYSPNAGRLLASGVHLWVPSTIVPNGLKTTLDALEPKLVAIKVGQPPGPSLLTPRYTSPTDLLWVIPVTRLRRAPRKKKCSLEGPRSNIV